MGLASHKPTPASRVKGEITCCWRTFLRSKDPGIGWQDDFLLKPPAQFLPLLTKSHFAQAQINAPRPLATYLDQQRAALPRTNTPEWWVTPLGIKGPLGIVTPPRGLIHKPPAGGQQQPPPAYGRPQTATRDTASSV